METLSDKMRIEDDHQLLLRSELEHSGYGADEEYFDNCQQKCILVDDVKDFIVKLKDELEVQLRRDNLGNKLHFGRAIRTINKLAGDKLI